MAANADHWMRWARPDSERLPRPRFLARVMNPHAQVDRCIVPKRSKELGKPGRVRIGSKVQKKGKRPLHQGQGAQNKLQVWPTSREEPRERISKWPAAVKVAYSQSSGPGRQDQWQWHHRVSPSWECDAGWRLGHYWVEEDTGGIPWGYLQPVANNAFFYQGCPPSLCWLGS